MQGVSGAVSAHPTALPWSCWPSRNGCARQLSSDSRGQLAMDLWLRLSIRPSATEQICMCCDAATGVPPSLQDIPGRSCESAALLDARTGSAGFCPGRGTRVCVKHGTWGLSDAVLHAQVRSTRRARNRRSGSVGGRQWRGSVSTLRGGGVGVGWFAPAFSFTEAPSSACAAYGALQ